MTIELGARYGLGAAAASFDTSAAGGASAGGVYFNSTDIFSSITSGAGIWQLQCCDGASVLGTNQSDPAIGSQGLSENIDIQFIISTPSATTQLDAGVYPVAIDFFNFNSTTDVANAIYRLEAEEDGTDGVFTGTVDYATMVHEGNSTNATAVIVPNTDEISLLLSSDKTGTSAPRLLYGDMDESNTLDVIGAQLDANTHSGVVTFDATSYGTDTIVHVTVTDPDLNQDSGTRESYSQERSDNIGQTAGS